MKLAIADPPYLGKAELLYGATPIPDNPSGTVDQIRKADVHNDAYIWDDPSTHKQMVADLVDRFDGFAIAMLPDNLYEYLQWVPRDTRVAVWHDNNVMPTGSHPRRRWEAVLVSRPKGRRRVNDVAVPVGDVLSVPHGKGHFAGRKPRQWTEWVLAMMGYCPTHDTVEDLFAGSGAVSATLAQGRLIECKCVTV